MFFEVVKLFAKRTFQFDTVRTLQYTSPTKEGSTLTLQRGSEGFFSPYLGQLNSTFLFSVMLNEKTKKAERTNLVGDS